jgi:Icc-related predicted phosphoesterase
MLNITCISDSHGFLPTNLKGGDILIHAGDICPSAGAFAQSNWINTTFLKWVRAQAKLYKHVIAVWGNHDFVGQDASYLINVSDFPANYYLLNNNSVTVEGLKIWGSPYSPTFGNWAFMLPDEKLQYIYEEIPYDTDIIVSHGPPLDYRDGAARLWSGSDDDTKWPDPEHVGSRFLRDRILKVNPKLVVCGHIHEAYSQETMPNGTVVVNASRMNLGYQPVNSPIEVLMQEKV